MKYLFSFFLMAISLLACNQHAKNENSITTDEEPLSFFPVTNYIKGQITEITTYGLAPLQYNLSSNKKDSLWLKPSDLDTVFKEFLDPLIDSTKTNKVQRVFIVKRASNKELQLTWQNEEWCSLRTIAQKENGEMYLEKEVLIKWKYD